jgi:Fungal Zn(2)-Cys(6) binuclear cluster domain
LTLIRRKLRCTGTQPCSRCSSHGLSCQYNALHRRGKPPSPEPAEPFQNLGPESASLASATSPPIQHAKSSAPSIRTQSDDVLCSNQQRRSSRSSQEPEETRFEGHYIGPTSGIAFLHRAQRRFKQDFAATISSHVTGKSSSQSSVFSFGDGYYSKYSSSDLNFPPRQQAKHLIDRYFDFAMPTYRFLHRATLESWLDRICDESENRAVDVNALSNAKVAIVLLTLATATLYEEDSTGSLIDSEADDCEQR